MVPLHNGMIISFVNYEIKVEFLAKADHSAIDEAHKKFFKDRPKGMLGYRFNRNYGQDICFDCAPIQQDPLVPQGAT